MSPIYLPEYEWCLIMGITFFLWNLFWVRPRFGSCASALLAYAGFSSIWVWEWVQNRYYSINVYDQMALRYFSADSLAKLLLILGPMLWLSENRKKLFSVGRFLAFGYVILNSWAILLSKIFTGCYAVNSCGGIGGNPSISVSLMVSLLPLTIRSWKEDWSKVLLVFAAVIISKSSIGLGLLAMYLGLEILRKRAFFYALAASIVPLALGALYLSPATLFDSSSRFMIWKFMMQRWAAPWNIPFGTGLGTFHVFSVNLQNVKGLPLIAEGSHWNTFHNDWLQMLFEGGVLGIGLFILVFLSAVVKGFRSGESKTVDSLLLFGTFMALNPALHFPIPAFFGAWLFTYALRKEEFRQINTDEGVSYA